MWRPRSGFDRRWRDFSNRCHIVRIDVIVDCSNEPLTELEKGLCEKALGEETTDVIETPPETPPEIPPETPPETEEPPTTEPIVE